jgi:hypothetical protein
MKKILPLLLWLGIYAFSYAQHPDKAYPLTTVNQQFGLSSLSIVDPYLSPLIYEGAGLTATYDDRRFLSEEYARFSWYNEADFLLGIASNETGSATMTVLGANAGTGVHYHLPSVEGFQFLLGGIWNFEFYTKSVSRNTNNSVNVDLASNWNFSAFVRKKITLFKRDIGFELQFQSPFAGLMFVPEQGASYYEMFSLEDSDLSKAFHFSSFHNKLAYKADFFINIPFNRSEWRLGLHAQNRKHVANESLYSMEQYGITIGITYDIYKFAGRKNQPPENFIKP